MPHRLETGQGPPLGVGERELAHPLGQRRDGLDPKGEARRTGLTRTLIDLFITHAASLEGGSTPHKVEFSFI